VAYKDFSAPSRGSLTRAVIVGLRSTRSRCSILGHRASDSAKRLRAVCDRLLIYLQLTQGMLPMNNLSVISSDKVEGTSVYNPAGEKLGSIDDLMIDRYSGQVRYAVLEFGGFLGMGTDRYPIPWSMLKYDDGKSGYVVPLDKARIEKAPKYTDERIPTYDVEYGQRVNSYYDDVQH
jgi:sporulation protein YlmC with PRC-barrel domain